MSGADVFIALNGLFGNQEKVNSVVRKLINHKAIWSSIQDPENFKKIKERFGENENEWDIGNICFLLADTDFDEGYVTFSNKSIDHLGRFNEIDKLVNSPSNEGSIKYIGQIAQDIQQLIDQKISWEVLLAKFNNITWQQVIDLWGTVFSIVILKNIDDDSLTRFLFSEEKEDWAIELLAFLIYANPQFFHKFKDWLVEESTSINIGNFTKLIQVLTKHGNQSTASVISKIFTKKNQFIVNNQKELISTSHTSIINNITQLNNYAVIAKEAGLEEESKKIISKSLDHINELELRIKAKLNEPNRKGFFQNKDNVVFDTRITLSSSSKKIIEKMRLAKELLSSDHESARSIAEEIYEIILGNQDLLNTIWHQDYGFIIRPEEVGNLLINLQLIVEAKICMVKILEFIPNNLELLQFLADLHYTQGDFFSAINYYSQIAANSNLSRDDIKKYAECLEYTGHWNEAYIARLEINFVCFDDIVETVICAIKAGEFGDYEKILERDSFGFKGSDFEKIFLANKLYQNGELEQSDQLIEDVCNSMELDYRMQILCFEYFLMRNELKQAVFFLEKFYEKEKKSSPQIIARLIEYYYLSDQNEKFYLLVNKYLNHSGHASLIDTEKIIKLLIEKNDLVQAEEYLEKISGEWCLAPNLRGLKARILNERGYFDLANRIFDKLSIEGSIDTEWLIDYCLSILKCNRSELPININCEDKNKARSIFNAGKNKIDKDVFYLLLDSELNSDSPLQAYQLLLSQFQEKFPAETWRIHIRLGNYYFENSKYDLAIVNFKESIKNSHARPISFLNLVKSYTKLKLWEEAITQVALNIDQQDIPISFFLEIQSSFNKSKMYISFLEKRLIEHPDCIRTRMLFSAALINEGQENKGIAQIEELLTNKELEIPDRLICTQILINAGQNNLARRIIEIIISSQKQITKEQYFSCAFLLEKMGEIDSVIYLINQTKVKDWRAIVYLAILKNRKGLVDDALNDLSDLLKSDVTFDGIKDLDINQIIGEKPSIWEEISKDTSNIYLLASNLSLQSKDIKKSYSFAVKGVEQNRENNLLLLLRGIDIATTLGEKSEIVKWKSFFENIKKLPEADVYAILGEIALLNGEEINAANYLSQGLDLRLDSSRLTALQCRILFRNGNNQEAESLFGKIKDKILEKKSIDKAESIDQISKSLTSMIWLAQTAFELKDYRFSLDICHREFELFGLFAGNIQIFLSSFAASLIENNFLNLFSVNEHLININNIDQTFFEEILINVEKNIINNKEISQLVIICKALISKNLESYKELLDNGLINRFPELQIEAHYMVEGLESVEILINSKDPNPRFSLLMAGLMKDTLPEKSLTLINNVVSNTPHDAVSLAGLAIVLTKLEQYENAYSAISLAIKIWPNEYEWEILAGNLSKEMGDLKRSFEHFENAKTINNNISSKEFMLDYLIAKDDPRAIEILLKNLKGSKGDAVFACKIGELYLKDSQLAKAAQYLNLARKLEPQMLDPIILLANVSEKVKNYSRAIAIIESALKIEPDNEKAILQKAEIVKVTKGINEAIIYLDEISNNFSNGKYDLIIKKAELLEIEKGKDAALQFLSSFGGKELPSKVLLERARLFFDLGQLEHSECEVNKSLRNFGDDSMAHALLGKISWSMGNLDRAIDFYIKAIRYDPIESDYYINLAEIYEIRKEYKKSIEVLRNGIKTNSNIFELHLRLGLKLQQFGYFEEGKDMLEKAYKINPKNNEIIKIINSIKPAMNKENTSLSKVNQQLIQG